MIVSGASGRLLRVLGAGAGASGKHLGLDPGFLRPGDENGSIPRALSQMLRDAVGSENKHLLLDWDKRVNGRFRKMETCKSKNSGMEKTTKGF